MHWKKSCLRLRAKKQISESLFVKWFSFSIFYNVFFYTQVAFYFHLEKDFYSVRKNILAFCFSILQKGLDTFHKLFESFFVFSIIVDKYYFIYKQIKKIKNYKINNAEKLFRTSHGVININILRSLHNSYISLKHFPLKTIKGFYSDLCKQFFDNIQSWIIWNIKTKKNEHTEMKYLNKNKFVKVRNKF